MILSRTIREGNAGKEYISYGRCMKGRFFLSIMLDKKVRVWASKRSLYLYQAVFCTSPKNHQKAKQKLKSHDDHRIENKRKQGNERVKTHLDSFCNPVSVRGFASDSVDIERGTRFSNLLITDPSEHDQ